MKRFSKLLAVVLAIAVIICPMTIFAETSTSTNGYKIEANPNDPNELMLTITSTDGFVAYDATVTFNSLSAFQSTYDTGEYENGLRLISREVKGGVANPNNVPTISSHMTSDTTLKLIVIKDNFGTEDLYTELVIGIRVAAGSTATLTKIQAADQGTVAEDSTLLTFPAANESTGVIDQTAEYAKENATITVHTHDLTLHPAVPATCTTAGNSAYYTCSGCDKIFSDSEGTHEIQDATIPATGHTPVTDEAVAPTCTATGLTAGSHCSVCGTVLVAQEVVSANGHTPVTDEAVAPTCTQTGLTVGSHCSVCGAVLVAQEEVPATGHTWGEYVSNNDATCTEDGTKTATCVNDGCGETDTIADEGSALGHDFKTYTSNGNGTHTAKCTRCEETDTKACNTEGTDGACSVCGYKAAPAEPVVDPNLANIILNQQVSVSNKIGIYFSISFKNPNKSGYTWDFDDFNFIISKKLLDGKTYSYTSETQDEVFSTSRYDRAFPSAKTYIFTYDKVGLYEMGSELTYTVKLFTGGVCTAQYTWEPTSLAEVITGYYLKQSQGTTLRNALADILNLGEACRQYFGNEKSTNAGNNTLSNMSPLNASVSAEDGCKDYGSLSVVEGQRDAAFSSVKLSLADAPSLYYTFRNASFKDVSTVTFTVSFTSMNTTLGDSGAVQQEFAATELPEAYTRYSSKTGAYNFSFEDAPLYDVDKVITLVVSNGVTSYTHQYSVLSLLSDELPTASTLAAGVYEAVARFNISCQAQFEGKW